MVPLGYEDSVGRPLHWRFGSIVCHRRSDKPRQDNPSRADMGWILQPCLSLLPTPPYRGYALIFQPFSLRWTCHLCILYVHTWGLDLGEQWWLLIYRPADADVSTTWPSSWRKCWRKIRSHPPSHLPFDKICVRKTCSIFSSHPPVKMIHPLCTSALKLEGFQLCPLSSLAHSPMNPYVYILLLVSLWKKLNENALWCVLFFKEDARKSWSIFRRSKETT